MPSIADIITVTSTDSTGATISDTNFKYSNDTGNDMAANLNSAVNIDSCSNCRDDSSSSGSHSSNSSSSKTRKASIWRSLVVQAAHKVNAYRLENGFNGALSPTPLSFIDLILSDEIFYKNINSSSPILNTSSAGNVMTTNNNSAVNIVSSKLCSSSSSSSSETDASRVRRVVDLGSGDGRWLIAFFKKFKCLCFGVEKDSDRLQVCQKRINNEFSVNSEQEIAGQSPNPNPNPNRKSGSEYCRSKIELIQSDFSDFCCRDISG
jgi:hypothetical protein